MRISLLCSDEKNPVNERLKQWVHAQKDEHIVSLVHKKSELEGGDILFLISCAEILTQADRSAYRATLVLHASDLPLGRGWSPHIWQIIEGANEITLSLLEADDIVDTGRIWRKLKIQIPADAMWDEINKQIFDAEIELMNFAVREFYSVKPVNQDSEVTPTNYPRRSPEDSRIDAYQSIASQFNQIRVCDPKRYPAFFELFGKKFKITICRIDE